MPDRFPHLAPDACARARRARDRRFDGLFFVAVRSTGVYCRPICPAPLALERNVRYYASAAAAAAAGFRPCLRCRPELAPGLAPCDAASRSFEIAWQRIRDGALASQSLSTLAATLGISERQFRRQFLQRLGVSPLAVHTTQRLLLAKQLLSETGLPVTEVALASGFRSLRRFNQAFLEGCGMPPGRLRGAARNSRESALRLRLSYRPPYDYPALLAFLARRAVPGIEGVEGDRYWRVVGSPEAPGRLWIEQLPAEHALLLRLECPDLSGLPELIRRLRRMFDLDAQPDLVAETLGQDPRLSASIAASPGRRVPGAFDGFETAVRAVLGQQVSVAAARTLCRRLVDAHGRSIELADGARARLFPTPEVIAEARLQSIGLPATRAATLRALARAVLDGRLDLEQVQPLDEFIERACGIPGIGAWTASYMAMRCLHLPDAFAAGDLVLRRQLGGGPPLGSGQVEVISQAWRPWRAYALIHLWSLADAATAPPPLATNPSLPI